MKLSTLLVSILFISSCAFAAFSWHEVLRDDYFKVDMIKNYTGNTIVSPVIPTSTVVSHIEEVKTKYVSSTKEQIEFEAKKNCAANKLGSQCVKDLMGMAYVESSFDIDRVWDNGEALGVYQIRYAFHKITKDQARNIKFATKWTMDNLIKHGYKKNRVVAIRMHNGNPNIEDTAIYYLKVNNYK